MSDNAAGATYLVRDAGYGDFGYLSKSFKRLNRHLVQMQEEQGVGRNNLRIVDKPIRRVGYALMAYPYLRSAFNRNGESFCIKIVEHEGDLVGGLLARSIKRGTYGWSAYSKVAKIEVATVAPRHIKSCATYVWDSVLEWARRTGHQKISAEIAQENGS